MRTPLQPEPPVRRGPDPLTRVVADGKFLRDGLESVNEDEIILKLISPLRPAVLQGEDDSFLYLIMPIRLAG